MADKVSVSLSFDLDAEATLDPDIVPQPGAAIDLSAEPGVIFLTGITGFVGAFLTCELLDQTQATIYCLVRATSLEHGHERIRQNLERYGLWRAEYAPRLVPVLGDLKLPLLGLSPETFRALADRVDSIYHCGSKLSYVAPYEFLKAANVGGTQETLRLATQGKPKPVHYVSSLGIFLAYRIPEGGQEEDELDASKCPDVGYFQTKYVAERVVRIARSRGIPVTIHRIGLIVGDSRSGVSNVDDFVARMLIGCIEAGFSPDVQNLMDMTPVDYVAAAMVYLSRQPLSLGKVFHLLNPQPIQWSTIFDFVSKAGYPTQKRPFNEWVEAIEEHGSRDTNPLYPLLPFFHIGFARRMLGVSDSHFYLLGTAATQRALAASGFKCSPVDGALIDVYLSHLVSSNRLQGPAAYQQAGVA
jgi:thioester reductase-like protein